MPTRYMSDEFGDEAKGTRDDKLSSQQSQQSQIDKHRNRMKTGI